MKLKFVVVYEQTPNNYAAYLPELPGCVSTGKNWDHIQEMIQEAVTFHLESMLEDGDPIPQGTMSLEDAMGSNTAHPRSLQTLDEGVAHHPSSLYSKKVWQLPFPGHIDEGWADGDAPTLSAKVSESPGPSTRLAPIEVQTTPSPTPVVDAHK